MKKILVLTDFSAVARHGLQYAILTCQLPNQHLILASITAENDSDVPDRLAHEAAQACQAMQIDYEASRFTFVTERGEFSVATIAGLVDRLSINVLIMGTTGATGFFGGLMDTSTAQLIGHVKCPVLAVPMAWAIRPIKQIGYGTDLTDLTERITEIVPLARRYVAEIAIFHVYPSFPEWVKLDELDYHGIITTLRQKNHLEAISLHFVRTPDDNQIVAGIDEFIRLYKPDLLIMCYQEQNIFDQFLSQNSTKRIALQAEVPLLALSPLTAWHLSMV